MCKVLHFDSHSVMAMTEMDHSRPCCRELIRTESDTHEAEGDTRKVCLLAASVYFLANLTKLHPIATPTPAHHNPTMTLAQNNDLS